MSGPLNYTTKIAAKRTVQECMGILADAGADAVAAQYRDKQPVGLSFRLRTSNGLRDFAMPVNIEGVQKMLAKANSGGRLRSDGHRNSSYTTREHAANVAWRVVQDWLEAQLAIIAAEMVTLDEVMLPYLQVSEGQTLYAAYVESGGLRMLEASRG
jgi:hypothetical protein